jgi:O-methyltransferase
MTDDHCIGFLAILIESDLEPGTNFLWQIIKFTVPPAEETGPIEDAKNFGIYFIPGEPMNMKKMPTGVGTTLHAFLVKINLEIVNFNDPESRMINIKINEIRKETELSMSNTAAIELFTAVRATGKIEGDIAEVGVFRGGSAKVICLGKGDRPLHLFDTFNGSPRPDSSDNPVSSKEGRYRTEPKNVRKYLAEFPNVGFYEGLFPDTSEPVKGSRFSLVHLDTDLHKSTIDCLEFFYPRMNQGGIIISHDYSYMSGVKKAFEEFFQDKPEIILGLPSYQCVVIKL